MPWVSSAFFVLAYPEKWFFGLWKHGDEGKETDREYGKIKALFKRKIRSSGDRVFFGGRDLVCSCLWRRQ